MTATKEQDAAFEPLELYELKKKVKQATGWRLPSRDLTDYLLEKLPEELHKDGKIYYLTLSAKYGDEFKVNYVTPSGYLYLFVEPEEDTPLKALLKLTLALKEAGLI